MLSRNFIMNKVIEKKLSWKKILVDKSAIWKNQNTKSESSICK